jgi:hypothetical protein
MKVKLLLVCALALSACTRDGSSTIPTDNPAYPLTKLFVHERCSVYRFYDDGWHYLVTCPGAITTQQSTCAKCSHYDEVIETVPVETP